MADSSFDIVSKIDEPEIVNSIDQALREVKTRFDLKDSGSGIDYDPKSKTITIQSSDDYKVQAVYEVLKSKLIKRGVSPKAFEPGDIDSSLGGRARQEIAVQQGISQDQSKQVVKLIKDAKIKVQASIQGDTIRVSGKKRDDLQAVIKLVKEADFPFHLSFTNYR